MKIYFASDVHLGIQKSAQERDKYDVKFISWLNRIAIDAEKIFLLGDIFDFWFEHRNTIPNYYGKVLAKLRELVDRGIEIHLFVGNHDMWTFGYLQQQIGLIIHHAPEKLELFGKNIVMGHGHNLHIDEPITLKLMNGIFNSKFLYKTVTFFLHADLMMWFGRKWSRLSRSKKNISHSFNNESEFVTIFCNRYLKKDNSIDYFIFGHLHTPIIYGLKESKSNLYILGEWICNPIYGVLSENGNFELIKESQVIE